MKRFITLLMVIMLSIILASCENENGKDETSCWNCGKGIVEEASFCSSCGAEQGAPNQPTTSTSATTIEEQQTTATQKPTMSATTIITEEQKTTTTQKPTMSATTTITEEQKTTTTQKPTASAPKTTIEEQKVTNHDHIYELKVVISPSCEVQGAQAYVCAICGKQQNKTNIAALEHNYQYSSSLSVSPTCTTNGKKVECCNNCGKKKEEIWSALGHSWHPRISCDSTTNEIVITPNCMQCDFIASNSYRYKVNDIKKMVMVGDLLAELDHTIVFDSNKFQYVQKAPYYRVYCSSTYILIVRNTQSFSAFYPSNAYTDPKKYYLARGCSVVFETNISIDPSGVIIF